MGTWIGLKWTRGLASNQARRMKIKTLFIVITVHFFLPCLALANSGYTNYPTLDEPTHYLESFSSTIRYNEDQTQAAFLLILLNMVSDLELADITNVAPPEDLKRLGLSTDLYQIRFLKFQEFDLSDISSDLNLPKKAVKKLDQNFINEQYRLAQKISNEPELRDIARLASISFVHPDPLIRIPAAALLYVLTAYDVEALKEIRAGISFEDHRLKRLAAVLLGRLKPDDSLLNKLTMVLKPDSTNKSHAGTTLVIHGTFAQDGTWWRNGYSFFEYLEHEVPITDLYLDSDPYSWTGKWSHVARLNASKELVQWMISHGSSCVNVVAHSHGGNIALLASGERSIGRLILLSTPSHKERYYPGDIIVIHSIRVHLDLVILADGGGNRFPNWENLTRSYVGWFNHSATHYDSSWIKYKIPNQLPQENCQ